MPPRTSPKRRYRRLDALQSLVAAATSLLGKQQLRADPALARVLRALVPPSLVSLADVAFPECAPTPAPVYMRRCRALFSTRSIAATLDVSPQTVASKAKRLRAVLCAAPTAVPVDRACLAATAFAGKRLGRPAGRGRKVTPAVVDRLRTLALSPDTCHLTLCQYRATLLSEFLELCGRLSLSTVGRVIRAEVGITMKRPTVIASGARGSISELDALCGHQLDAGALVVL